MRVTCAAWILSHTEAQRQSGIRPPSWNWPFFQSSGLSPARRRRMRDLSIPQDQASFPGTFVAKKLTVRL